MDIDNPSEMVYKEILDHIDVHKNKVLDIWLKSVPFGIRLKIETEGRSTTYKTKILETELIEKVKESYRKQYRYRRISSLGNGLYDRASVN